MNDPKTGISEPTVILPIGMDCRELKYRMKDVKSGSSILCTPNEIEQMWKGSKDGES